MVADVMNLLARPFIAVAAAIWVIGSLAIAAIDLLIEAVSDFFHGKSVNDLPDDLSDPYPASHAHIIEHGEAACRADRGRRNTP